jgi:nicotinamide-nucleotide amidase
VETAAFRAATAAAGDFEAMTVRLFGIPESEIAATLREARAGGIDIDRMEITTCLRRGEIEIVTRYDRADADLYRELAEHLRARHADTIFSEDGSTVDEQIAALLDGPPQRTIAVAESCTGGLLAARLTAPAGASARMLGGVVAYANSAKEDVVGVEVEVIERVGAVSAEVAEALADGAIERFGADVGVGITGVAGPDGGTAEKPVGTVWFSVALAAGGRLTRRVQVPGDRQSVRDRSSTIAMHLIRRALRGELEGSAVGEPASEHRA